MIEMVLDGVFDEPGRFGRGQPVLGLALELRLADEQRQHDLGAGKDIFTRQLAGFLVAGQRREVAQAAGEGGAQAGFMGAAIGRGDGVAVKTRGAFAIVRPGAGPFDRALVVGKIRAARKQLRRDHFAITEPFAQMVGKPAGKLEHRGFRRVAIQ